MPHVIIKLWPGRSNESKKNLSNKISKAIVEELGTTDRSVSVDFVEVPENKWMDEVYNKEIAPKFDELIKKPGYGNKSNNT